MSAVTAGRVRAITFLRWGSHHQRCTRINAAYRNGFRNKSDVMVLEPSSDFFKYLKNPNKGGK